MSRSDRWPLLGRRFNMVFHFRRWSLGGSNKIFGIVANMDWDGEELSHWFYRRCGKSEESHAAIKEDLAGVDFHQGSLGRAQRSGGS